MAQMSEKNNGFSLNQAVRSLIILSSIVLISLVFPKFLYQDLQVGEAWGKADVIAKKDINYSLDQSEVSSQLKSYIQDIGDVYSYEDINAGRLAKNISNLVEADTSTSNSIKTILVNCYNTGLFQNTNTKNNISIVKEGIVSTFDALDLCTREDLFNQVRDELADQSYVLNASKRRQVREILMSNVKQNNSLKDDLIVQKEDALNKTGVSIAKGNVIVKNGEKLTQSKYDLIKQNTSKFSLDNKGINIRSFLGYFLLTGLIISVLLFYVRKYFNHIYISNKKLIFILMWPVIFSYLVYAIENHSSLSTYVIPFCIVPIVVKNFFEDRLALIIHVVVILIASILSRLGYEFTFLQILAGMVTVLIVSETRYWDKFFLAIGFIILSYVVGFFGLQLATWSGTNGFEWANLGWMVANGLLLLLAYPFIPLLENIFGFTSSIKLAELSDMNKPLLRDLSLKAPGTLQHSLQVANLSEAAAKKIGADSLLVKTAALYHDIGKMTKPEYFIENAKGENVHQALDNNFESTRIIVGHITDGVELAKKNRLPQVIIDFIKSHHGTTRVEYFYRNQLKQHPDKEFDETIFRYKGPLPKSKEETILMIADSIEAASKSLKNPTGQDIDQLIDKIVAYKIDEHQLENSKLSFSELGECVDVFKTMLRSINHVRVEYPDAPDHVAS